jgi:hypothetical protein
MKPKVPYLDTWEGIQVPFTKLSGNFESPIQYVYYSTFRPGIFNRNVKSVKPEQPCWPVTPEKGKVRDRSMLLRRPQRERGQSVARDRALRTTHRLDPPGMASLGYD